MDGGDRTVLDHPASAARCSSFSRDGCPGALRSISPSGPCALNFSTQSRTICSGHPADLAPPGAAPSVIDRRQRQQPPHLVGILTLARNPAQRGGVKIRLSGIGFRMANLLCSPAFKQIVTASGNPNQSPSTGLGISVMSGCSAIQCVSRSACGFSAYSLYPPNFAARRSPLERQSSRNRPPN